MLRLPFSSIQPQRSGSAALHRASTGSLALLALTGLLASADLAWAEPRDIGMIEDVVVVGRRVSTINFRRPGSTGMSVPLVGTSLAPESKGSMGIDTKPGYVQLKAGIQGLSSAATFGDEYMTYVLWAITPEGRATNLGEFLVESSRDSKAHLEVTSELQAFGLIVTAEPHFGVTMPSNVVVMENGIPESGGSRVETVDADYQLLERGTYSFHGESRTGLEVPSVPFYVVQARNARRIAIDSGARTHASDALTRGEGQLLEAETGSSKDRSVSARQAAQTFEDARLISVEASRVAREERVRAQAMTARADATSARSDASDARADANAAQDDAARARAELADAERRSAASETEKAALRARLRDELQVIFETQDNARGLVLNMSNVLFAFNQDVLRPQAREKLSRLAGIILSNAGLQLAVEGHADSIGSDLYNMALSERRAGSVRTYLMSQGLQTSGITARGFGESKPIAENGTATGRSLNRRVEIVLTGDVIGQATLND